MKTHPVVVPHPDGYKATWPQWPRAFALFSKSGDRVSVTDIFRDPGQPKGSAGSMLADAFAMAGIRHPKVIRMSNILESQPTLAELAAGKRPAETVLGKTLSALVNESGGTIKEWRHGIDNRGKPWLEVEVGSP